MIRFNLKEYLKNPSRKVITGEGKEVRILCTDANISANHSIIALIKEPNGNDTISTYAENGQFFSYVFSKEMDLFFAPEKHEGWVNIYQDFGLGIRNCKCIFGSKEEALRNSDQKAIATVKIEWEE